MNEGLELEDILFDELEELDIDFEDEFYDIDPIEELIDTYTKILLDYDYGAEDIRNILEDFAYQVEGVVVEDMEDDGDCFY